MPFNWLRKSVSSSSSTGQEDNTPGTPLSKPTSRLAKTLSWRSGTSNKPAKKPAPVNKRPHPSERPLNETNLRHQELLSAFTMNFGRRKASAGGRTSYSGISPGSSRHASVDACYSAAHPERKISTLAHDVPREEAE